MKNNKIATIVMKTLFIFISVLTPTISMPHYSSLLANLGTRNIGRLPCISMQTGKTGVCMFALDCVKANGTHLGTCLDWFYFGSCCRINGETDTYPHDNTIEESFSLIPTKKPLESNDIPEIVTIRHSQPQKPSDQNFSTNKPTAVDMIPTTTITSVKPQTNNSLSSFQATQNDYPSTLQFFTSIQTSTERHPATENPIIDIQRQPVTTSPNLPLSLVIEKITPTTRFPPRNSTTTATLTSTATAVLTVASALTSIPARPISVFTNQPIVTTAVTDRHTTTENIQRPTRPSPTILLTTKPFEFTTDLTSLTSSSKKPLIGLATTSKLSQSSSTEFPQLNTTTSNKTKPSSKPTKTSSKPMKTSSKPLLTDSAKPTGKPKPSSKPTRYQKPPKPTTITTSTTVGTALLNSSTMTLSSSKTSISTTTTTTTTTSRPTTIISRPLGDLIKHSEETPTTVKIISIPENNSTPFQFSTTTNNFISKIETSTQNFVTWSSNSDELVTSTMVSLLTTQELEETTETEWSSITSPGGGMMIQNLSTKQPENETSTSTEISSINTSSLFAETLTDIVSTTEKVSLPTLLPTTDHLTLTTVSPNPIDRYNMSDYKQVCGRRLFPESRIVGGARSSFGKWPWQISLRQWRNSVHLHKCGAALLNENWAITAAHCVENVPPSELLLRIGEYDLANEDEPYGFQERRVHMVASHPAFDPRTFEYDLALLRFYEPLKPFQPNYLPICVPDDDEGYVGQAAYVTGWGRLYEDGPLPSVLQEVSVPIINNSECEEMYRAAGYIEHIPKIFICAGWKKGGSDSCEGDSGGPLVVRRPRDNRWILAGVISWGIGCAMPFQPGVYTRISEFKEWINQILKF